MIPGSLHKITLGYNTNLTGSHTPIEITSPSPNISHLQQNISYNTFNKVKKIAEQTGVNWVDFTYGPDAQRMMTKKYLNGQLDETKYFLTNYEEVNGTARQIHYIYGGDGLAAIYEIKNSTPTMYYAFTDHLGSIHYLTNANYSVSEYYSFDPWGRRRNPTDWDDYGNTTHTLTDRGFTGHEHLDDFSLINMNGRVYDPVLGQFLSPDNYVATPGFSQGYNRYAYCLNNPLIYTDPSGEFLIEALTIGLYMYAAGVQSNFMHAMQTGGNPFNPGDWNWKSPWTYISLAFGAYTGFSVAYPNGLNPATVTDFKPTPLEHTVPNPTVMEPSLAVPLDMPELRNVSRTIRMTDFENSIFLIDEVKIVHSIPLPSAINRFDKQVVPLLLNWMKFIENYSGSKDLYYQDIINSNGFGDGENKGFMKVLQGNETWENGNVYYSLMDPSNPGLYVKHGGKIWPQPIKWVDFDQAAFRINIYLHPKYTVGKGFIPAYMQFDKTNFTKAMNYVFK